MFDGSDRARTGCPGFPSRRTNSVRRKGNTHESRRHESSRRPWWHFWPSPSVVWEDQPAKQWVWLESQGVWGYGYQIQDGPHRGLWRVDPDSKRPPEEAVPTTDPYGFAAILNQYRAEAGLPPLAYDHELSAWAASNNAAQSSLGMGHHVTPNCYQNAAWNAPDAASVGPGLDGVSRSSQEHAGLVGDPLWNRLRPRALLDHEREVNSQAQGWAVFSYPSGLRDRCAA